MTWRWKVNLLSRLTSELISSLSGSVPALEAIWLVAHVIGHWGWICRIRLWEMQLCRHPSLPRYPVSLIKLIAGWKIATFFAKVVFLVRDCELCFWVRASVIFHLLCVEYQFLSLRCTHLLISSLEILDWFWPLFKFNKYVSIWQNSHYLLDRCQLHIEGLWSLFYHWGQETWEARIASSFALKGW